MRKVRMAKAWLAVVLCGTVMWTACSMAWIGEAEQIAAALIPAVTNIVALVAALQGNKVSDADLLTIQNTSAEVEADLQLMESLMAAYQNADARLQPGLLNQIQAAIDSVQSSLSGLLAGLHIKDAATQAKVSAVIGLALAEVESLAAIVPLVNPNASAGMMAARKARTRAPLTANEFVSSYNATMTAKTGNAELDRAAAGLKIRLHSRIVRWASAGILK
jgi:hypothetical protein